VWSSLSIAWPTLSVATSLISTIDSDSINESVRKCDLGASRDGEEQRRFHLDLGVSAVCKSKRGAQLTWTRWRQE